MELLVRNDVSQIIWDSCWLDRDRVCKEQPGLGYLEKNWMS